MNNIQLDRGINVFNYNALQGNSLDRDIDDILEDTQKSNIAFSNNSNTFGNGPEMHSNINN